MAEKEYIERNAIEKWLLSEMASLDGEEDRKYVVERLRNEIPAADVREVVYCRNCKWTKTDGMDDPAIYCEKWDRWEMPPDGFCCFGKKREG